MADTDIKITEIHNDPTAGPDSTHEWIEIQNTGASDVDLQDWSIDDVNPASPTVDPNISAGVSTILGAGAYGILYDGDLTEVAFTTAFGPFPIGTVLIPVASFPSLNNSGDNITLENAAGTAIQSLNYPDGEIAGGSFVVSGDGTVFTPEATPTPGAVCYAAGTLIATPEGERTVESLALGDMIQTADGQLAQVKWIGVQTVLARFSPAERNTPIQISAGALGPEIPHTNLVVSADHGMVIDGLVINASVLANGDTIRPASWAELNGQITYFHIETDAHQTILANGAAAETYVDYVGRQAFDNYADYVARFGEQTAIAEMPLPRISSARQLPDALRMKLGIIGQVAVLTGT